MLAILKYSWKPGKKRLFGSYIISWNNVILLNIR